MNEPHRLPSRLRPETYYDSLSWDERIKNVLTSELFIVPEGTPGHFIVGWDEAVAGIIDLYRREKGL
jgi:hypothetical protein